MKFPFLLEQGRLHQQGVRLGNANKAMGTKEKNPYL